MEVVRDAAALGRVLDSARAAGRPVHFVPTMGNLHEGHLTLVDRARTDDALVVVSIFVNPTQFGPGEDFEHYPRTLDEDCRQLDERGCDLVWAPTVEQVYPLGIDRAFRVRVPDGLTSCLCGRNRPGHFDGVASVVLRLFGHVRPNRAVFGEKDYQQLLVIRRLVRDFSLGVEVVAAPTVRAEDGLALSSRNRYLDPEQRRVAPALFRALGELARETARKTTSEALDRGTFGDLERSGMLRLESSGFRPDYVEIRAADDLGPPSGRNDRVFAAAWLGSARLIDNVAVNRHTRG